MPQLAQRLRFDLPNTFAGDRKRLADFLESVLAAIIQTKPHLDNFLFARRQRLQHRRSLFLQAEVDHRIRRRHHRLVFNEIAQMRILFLADRSLQRNGFLRDFQNLADFRDRNIHALGDFFRRRFAPQFLHQLALRAHQLVDRFDHVHWNTNRAGLIGDRAGDGLPDPPRRVSRKLISAAPFEFVNGLHQADVSFLNQVQKLQTAVGVFLRDRNHQPQVRFDQFFLGLFRFRFAPKNHLQPALQFRRAYFLGRLVFPPPLPPPLQTLPRFGLPVRLRRFHPPFQLDDFALQEMDALHGVPDFFDQPLLLEQVELELPHPNRHLPPRARQHIACAKIRTLLRLRHFFQLGRLLQRQQVKLRHAVNLLQRRLGLRFDFFFGKFFVVELDDFLDRTRTVAQIFPDLQQFLQNQRRPRNRFQHQQLAALDALGNRHFAFAREQWNRTHFAQIHAYRIVRLFQRTRCQIEFAIFRRRRVFHFFYRLSGIRRIGRRQRRFRARKIFVHVDAITFKRRKQVVNFFRGMDLRRQDIVHFVVQEISALLAHRNKLSYLIVFFFESYRHTFPLAERSGNAPRNAKKQIFQIKIGRRLDTPARLLSNSI